MQAVRLERLGYVATVDVPEPVPVAGDLLVRVDAAGICGSDRHLVSGEYPSQPPVTLGHEVEGTVVDAGPSARVGAGARVAVDPNIFCGHCRYCRNGLVSHCAGLRAIGVDRDGGLAQYVSVPESQAFELPPGMPVGFGALCEPLACCLRAMDHAQLGPGQSALVLGGGVIGQLLAQLARLAGAKVVLVTRQEQRRALAASLGAAATVDPTADDVVSAVTGPGGLVPGGVDVAFEAAGVGQTLVQAIQMVRRAGRVVVVGAAPQALTVPISPFELFARELQIFGSHLNPLTHHRAVALAASGALELGPLVTTRAHLGEIPGLLAREPRPGEVKVLAFPN